MAEFSSITTISKELQALTLTGVKRVDNQSLGTGSYGQVFAVKHGRKTYAAKQIHSILVEAVSPEEKRVVRDSFLKECHHCKNLDHPNIVRFIGVYYPDPHSVLPVMVMELMDTSLTDYVNKPNIIMKLKVSILHDVAQGLKFLHCDCRVSPIIHRDLSPNNILLLLSRDLVAKISDLGVVKVVKAGTKSKQNKLTKAPGTADFMPPEALSDNPTYSTGLDIFSYGGVILHVVNQEWPKPTNPIEFDNKMKPVKMFTEVERRQRYLDMMTVEAERLKSLVIRCLDNDPAKRPAAANVLEELKELKVQQECQVINKNVKSSDNSIPLGTDMVDTSQYAILLDSTVGYEEPKSWLKDAKDWVFGKQKQYSEKKIVRGTLLKTLNEKEVAPHFDLMLNYKVLSSEHTIWLHCEPNQIRGLTYEKMRYLQAVKACNDRLEALPKLDWLGSLTPGSGCFLDVLTVYGRPIKVTIRYIGNLPGKDDFGTYFGVELLECRNFGNTNGSFGEHQLFDCPPKCGLFVSMDKLILNEIPMIHQPLQQESVTNNVPFKKNDRVEAFDAKAVSEKGTVKWIGRNNEVLPNGTYIVGIHTDQVIHNLQDRFPNRITGMNHLIEHSREHSTLFLPVHLVKKIEDQGGIGGMVSNGHNYVTRSPQQSSYYPVSSTIRRHTMNATEVEHQKEALKKFEQRKEEVMREKETIESNERRHQMQQIKNELQIRETEGFDDTMLDPKTQQKIMEDIKRQRKFIHVDKTKVTYNKQASAVPQSQSPLSDYQQLHDNQHIAQQGMHPQDVYSRRMFHPDVGQQRMYSQGTPQQGIYYPQQGIYYPPQGRSPQNMSSQYSSPQGMASQGVPYHRIPQQDMQMPPPHDQYPQGAIHSSMGPGHPYQQAMPQNYQTQHYNRPFNNDNWRSENPGPLYPVEKVEFHHILRAGTNATSDTNSSDTSQTIPTRQYQTTSQDMYRPPEQHRQMEAPDNMSPLEEGDTVQYGYNPIHYGVIKWTGELPGSTGLIAGVEMEQPVVGATDGRHDGYQYFMCEPGMGMFLHLSALRRDDRFGDDKSLSVVPHNPFKKMVDNLCEASTTTAHFVQAPEELNVALHTGVKGIQGNQNSCYLDATLYGMFAFSNAFDALFLEKNYDNDFELRVKNTLQQKIVNPLRKVQAVVQDALLELQKELSTLQKMKGLSDEKDPQEFLNLLFKHVLHVEPFLHLNRPPGTDKEFFIELFVGPDENVSIPDTHWLLHKMFKDGKITFKKYPQKLLLQIPRHRKAFECVKPTLKLDVSVLCEGYAGPCFICNKPGKKLCNNCSCLQLDLKNNLTLYFCEGCSVLWHSHPERQSHKPVAQKSTANTHPLELLSVLCIETSHYVCFTRITGSGKDQWVFFDSMAERTDDEYNLPRVTDCTDEINEWVYGDKDISKVPLKQLPELVRRYVGDPYLCIYTEFGGNLY